MTISVILCYDFYNKKGNLRKKAINSELAKVNQLMAKERDYKRNKPFATAFLFYRIFLKKSIQRTEVIINEQP
jgi:hypothetical protein